MFNSNSPIGFFDSGVGGLSVYSKFKKQIPNENTIYYGDTINLPYGNKTKEQLINFARKILNFFREKNVKAVIIACNTSSALAYEVIKDEYDFEIYPIIQSCAKVISEINLKRIGVFATEGTVNSCVYSKEIKKHRNDIEVMEIACPNWVRIVENGGAKTDRDLEEIYKYADLMKNFNPDKIILGCTHYPYLLDVLCEKFSKETFIDPAGIFVNYIKDNLSEKQLLSDNKNIGTEAFYVSSCPEKFVKNAELFYHLDKLPIVN